MCKMKISNKSIFPIFNIVFRFKCENKLIWNHDEINKNTNTGSNYYMNFNLKGESHSFKAVKKRNAKWEEVEIVITDPFGFITNHITYKQVRPI